jgi:phosphoglucosamine mutase
MNASIFGTDGVRGLANSYPLTPGTLMKLAQSAGLYFNRQGHRTRVVIGKDTRLSGYMMESALTAGFTSIGIDVELTGPLPTPAIAMLTRSLRADFGVMISASHNPYHDNGIKFFGPDGFKLSDAAEAAIERGMETCDDLVAPAQIGRARRIDGAAERYMEFAKLSFPKALRLDGLKVVVDAAHGAAFRTAPSVIWELGAEVIQIGTDPDGLNINAGFGSTAPMACQKAVLSHGADIGIVLDGDADRILVIDEKGRLIDGDQLMALIAERAQVQGKLRNATVVATVMSNNGLKHHLGGLGIDLVRAHVGDRHVVEKMRELDCSVGGEQSGHIILSEFSTTGDGLIAALQALAALAEVEKPASEILTRFSPLPQLQRNVKIEAGTPPLNSKSVQDAIENARLRLGREGRVLVRPSGTEPLIRIMAEGSDAADLDAAITEVCEALRQSSTVSASPALWREEVIANSLPPLNEAAILQVRPPQVAIFNTAAG